MTLGDENVPRQDCSWLRSASLLTVAVAAVMWAGIVLLSATGSVSFTFWDSTHGDKAATKEEKLSQAFRAAAKRVLPAVIVIKTSNGMQTSGGATRDEHLSGPSVQESPDEEESGWQLSPGEAEPGLGSGVVIDPKGIVLTNNHVVEGADELLVRLSRWPTISGDNCQDQ